MQIETPSIESDQSFKLDEKFKYNFGEYSTLRPFTIGKTQHLCVEVVPNRKKVCGF